MEKKIQYFLIMLTMLIMTVSVLSGCGKDTDNTGTTGGAVFDGEKVKIDFYVMSQCPYGTQVEDAIAPVLKTMGDAVDFELNFIGGEDESGFRSLHGESEINGDMVQLCALNVDEEKAMEMIVCMNKEPTGIPNNWQPCAESAGLDVEAVRACYEGEQGKELLRESFAKASEAGAQGSPTMFFNGEDYSGPRDSLSFQRQICNFVPGHSACADVPECATDVDCLMQTEDKIGVCVEGKCEFSDPVELNLVVLTDSDCGQECDTTQVLGVSKQLFRGMSENIVEVDSEEGKEMIEKYGIIRIPAYLFDEKVTETYAWKSNEQLQTAFEKKEDKYKLLDEATGAVKFVNEDVEKKYFEKAGITIGDGKPQIDFYVMSYCPYGNIAEEAIAPVFEELKEFAEFNPRYVIYSNYQGGGPEFCLDNGNLCSMHGIQELNQDIREMCVNKLFGTEDWFEFAMEMNKECTYQNADSCWEDVAVGLGLDADAIAECEKNEGVELARKDKELNDIFGVSGSPTIFIEGMEYSGARSSQGYMAALCGAFDGNAPDACDNVENMESTSEAPAGACG
ncbi:thioredoxin domain-containing protein [Candidatus Woesearchaeota archaeon]|nr:thioredoxin domain-containing protein [Candidatus Woesearchaeota archaeon]